LESTCDGIVVFCASGCGFGYGLGDALVHDPATGPTACDTIGIAAKAVAALNRAAAAKTRFIRSTSWSGVRVGERFV
jgi:hypothetical protein